MTIPTYSPRQLLARVRVLDADLPISNLIPPPRCYAHHRQHWVGWLNDYCEGRAYYGRKNFDVNASDIYNRVQCYGMLVWLAEAAGVASPLVLESKARAERSGTNAARQAGSARSVVPWPLVCERLWPLK